MLLVGAFAKSAQVPLHTWLPDAMEGPTPVSALIHAATMVTAGVYLIARMHPLFELAPTAADVERDPRHARRSCSPPRSRWSVTDLKRVIAYSTMSQIGYMILGVSRVRLQRRAVPPDDARLLQGAALHERRLGDRRDGRRARTWTGWAASGARCRSRSSTFTIGALALAGFPPIVRPLLEGRDPRVRDQPRRPATRCSACSATSARCLTAFYAVPDGVPHVLRRARAGGARARCAASWRTASTMNPATGEEEDTDVGFPGPEHHIAERERPMKAAMAPLALLAIVAGVRRDPGRDRRARQVPRADLRRLALRTTPRRATAPSGSASLVGACSSHRRHRRSPTAVRAPRRHHARSCASASARAARLPRRTSGTSTSSTTALVRAARSRRSAASAAA